MKNVNRETFLVTCVILECGVTQWNSMALDSGQRGQKEIFHHTTQNNLRNSSLPGLEMALGGFLKELDKLMSDRSISG